VTNPLRSAFAAIVFLIAWVSSPLVASADGPATEGRSGASEQIDAVVERWMESTGTPGISVAIVRAGETVHLSGYGQAADGGSPVTPDTPFLIGSVSKPFTAVAVFQLVGDGRLRLNEPLRPYLDAAVEGDTATFDGVTLEHLMMHTSGLPMSLGLPGTAPIRTGSNALELRVGDIVGQYAPSRNPGERYEYSNANYILLAWVIERVTGVAFAQYVEDNVFGALAMTSSFASDAHPSASQLATGHESWFGRWLPSHQPYDPAGAAMGYMGSTGRDLAAYLHAHLGDEQVDALPVRAVDVLARPAIPTGWDVMLESHIADGWFVDELGGFRTVSHAGSLGNFTAHLVMVPDADGLGIAVLQNASAFIAAGHEGQYGLSLELLELLLGLEPQARAFPPLLIVVAPAAAWGIAVVIVASALGSLLRRRRPRNPRQPALVRRLVPAAAYLAFGLTVLVVVPALAGVPWTSIQLFYPDVGWGLFVVGCLALAWGAVRLIVVLAGAQGPDPTATSSR
jgi:CubicO group peptidase (beta-lactamase class C family)